MNIRRLSLISIAVLVLIISVSGQAGWWPFSKDEDGGQAMEITEINWNDLIPDDFVQPVNPLLSMTQEEIDILMDGSEESNARLEKMREEFNYAPTNGELDGKRVKLPAYVTPLEFDGQTRMKEFLLVPYVGACIHTPPPPANQVVHANSPETIEIKSMYDAVWAIGTLRTQTVTSSLAESGYLLEVEEVLPYSQ